MKTTVLLCLLVGIMNLQSADFLKVLECHDKVVRQGGETLGFPKEVETLFGATNVDHFISGFDSKSGPAVWNSVAYFAGKYKFSLKVPVSIEYKKCEFLGAVNSAQVQINEVTKVEISTSGIAGAIMDGQWQLNENQWKWLVKNKGDWSVVNVPIVTNSPVKGFDEYVRQLRAPIRGRRENFDNIIRKGRGDLRKVPGKNEKGDTNNY